MDLKKIKIDFKDPATLCTLGGCVILLLACFLPVVKELGVNISLMQGNHHGIVHLILIIAIVVLLVLNQTKILSGVLAAEAVWCIWDIRSVANTVSEDNKYIEKSIFSMEKTTFQIGFYLLIIGAIALIAAIVLSSLNAKKNAAPAQPQQYQ